MSKNQDSKSRKNPTKKQKRRAGKSKTIMAISFEEVSQKSHNFLIAARGRHRQVLNGRTRRVKTDSKAIHLKVDFTDKADPYRARVEAVRDFLTQTQKSQSVTLIVSDSKFLDIVEGKEPDASEAIADWNELCEGFNNIEVVSSWSDKDPSTANYGGLVRMADMTLKGHKNEI